MMATVGDCAPSHGVPAPPPPTVRPLDGGGTVEASTGTPLPQWPRPCAWPLFSSSRPPAAPSRSLGAGRIPPPSSTARGGPSASVRVATTSTTTPPTVVGGRMGSAFDGRDVRSGRSRALLARTSWRARLPCPSLSAVSPTAPPASRGVSKVGLRWSSLDLYGQRFSHFWRSPLVRAGRCPPLAAWRCALRSPFLALPPSDVHGCGSCNDGAAGPAADRFR